MVTVWCACVYNHQLYVVAVFRLGQSVKFPTFFMEKSDLMKFIYCF